ncbi:MAG TPA: ABC transporter ATP-binding protein [Spirochaetota bacterium]|nr:ABC transporter ATP-binding protein [Spirochaetota bacterium]
MVNICKSFGDVRANNNITFSVNYGEIYALLGENGAGKSTLVNMLSGVYTPDSGEIYVHGKRLRLASPADSISSGIGMIHQHFKLVNVMTALENIAIGQEHGFLFNRKHVRDRVEDICSRYGFKIEPDKQVRSMSVGEKQTVEILKVLYRGADILILDEPTAVLTPQETERLFDILLRMKEQGCAIIIITHKLHEVMEISDRVSVLRRGEVAGTVNTSDTSPVELTGMMVGKKVELSIERPAVRYDEMMLEVKDLSLIDREGIARLDDVSFTVRRGEILGVAGVAGSGQKELCESIQGLERRKRGEILFKGENIAHLTPRAIFEKGMRISFIPEDRLGMGLVPTMDIVDNVILKDYYLQKGIFLSREPARKRAEHIVKMLNVHTPGIYHPVNKLLGGNIQKVLLGREIDSTPDFLVTAYPTRGLDIGSAHLIYDELNRQKERGVGILYVGEDLNILLSLCDRIMVMFEGKIIGTVDAAGATKEEIGLMMLGETPGGVTAND